MFRHRGKTRTYKHNLQIASLLSLIAGTVNVVGFLAVQRLTTNITGHFAFFMEEVIKPNFLVALHYFLYILFFFFGSFTSSFIIEIVARKSERFIFAIPVLVECVILIIIGCWPAEDVVNYQNTIAYSLLFAMGLQNSLVTKISNANVRTTHLTGLFTDLGIDLSQIFFLKSRESRKKLFSSIKLRGTIILFFFLGGVVGGLYYVKHGLTILIIAAVLLLMGLIYDSVKFRIIQLRRKM
jgi:uncharacterized membrane protein YoaK (UPF0700 family)